MEENSRDNQKMDDLVQGCCLVEDGGIFSENFLDPGLTFSDISGVDALGRRTEGAFSQILLSRLNLGGFAAPDDSPAHSSPPRSPSSGINKHTLLSPVTPLDLLGSPVQPLKKLRASSVGPVKIKIGDTQNWLVDCCIAEA